MNKTQKKQSTSTSKTTRKSAVTKKTVTEEKTSASGSKSGSLIIVESPTKAKTLTKYLGSSYTVKATNGHIIDLPPSKFGVDILNGFKPDYIPLPGKDRIIKDLNSAAAKVSNIFIATDPDREGEAIAWHVSNSLSNKSKKNVRRVQFHEITANAVKEALKQPGEIDQKKVDAQQARRVMDRLVGYQVSPLLWKTITKGLSAGRVQSVALRIICEREAEIAAFVSEEYWSIHALFAGKNVEPFLAKLHKIDGKKPEIPSKEVTDNLVNRIQPAAYHIGDIRKSRKKRQPYPPYITSTLQQDAGRRLNFTTKKTMTLAQRLYEGVELSGVGLTGLITYMRTDSLRVSNEAIKSTREFIAGNYGVDLVAPSERVYKNKKGAVQDAHEAIRPSDVLITPASIKKDLSPDEFKLYDLIWRRFVATQMKDAELDVTVVSIYGRESNSTPSQDKFPIEFRASGQVLVFSGFLTVYDEIRVKEKDADDEDTTLPNRLEVGLGLTLNKLDPKQHFTQPPPRFNESSLVKELDEKGIGRPSTYATIISTLIDRKYVDRKEKAFIPTDLGVTVNKMLVHRFPDIFNVEFTAKMEGELDRVEEGYAWQSVVAEFYTPFSKALGLVEENKAEIKKESLEPVGRKCPDCGSELVYRWSKRGRFISCSAFPNCKHAESINGDKPVVSDQKCPKCGSEMIVRSGRFGSFLGCSAYPKCKGILPLSTGHKCPVEGCTGSLSEKRSKKGKVFFGCTRYPDCDFVSWDSPVDGPCPECGAPTLLLKSRKAGDTKYCHRCQWKSEA